MIRWLGWLALAIGLTAAAPDEVAGLARVVDGDTFDLGTERVRLWGAMRRRAGRSARTPTVRATPAATSRATSSLA